jgi:hypothetical protein
MKPFAVVDAAAGLANGGGGEVFDAAVARNSAVIAVKNDPSNQNPILDAVADFVAKSIAGRPAAHAGDPALRSRTRTLGVVYPAGPTGIDIERFRSALAREHVKLAVEVPFSIPTTNDSAEIQNVAQATATTAIAKFKSAGVTTVIPFMPGQTFLGPLTKVATSQEFRPEWIVTPYGNADFSFLARTYYDQDQWAHAIGVGWFAPPVVEASADIGVAPFEWYWGKDQGTRGPAVFRLLEMLYLGIHGAGPDLSVRSLRDGQCKALPPTGGAASHQVTTVQISFCPGTSAYQDFTRVFYSPETTGPSQVISSLVGKGVYVYLDKASRYTVGKFPASAFPRRLDVASGVTSFSTVPANEQVPSYPCTGCPSSRTS